MVDPRQGCQLEPLQVGLAAVTWPDHIPRPVPSSGDLRAGGESHSPLLPDFCPDHQNRISQEGRLQRRRHVGCCQASIPPSHTGAGWGALEIKKVRLVGARRTTAQQRRRLPQPLSPCLPAGCEGHSTTLALHSLLSALGLHSKRRPRLHGCGREDKSIFIVGVRRLVWLSSNAFIPSGLGAALSGPVPLAAPYQPGTVIEARGAGLCCAWRLLPGWQKLP